ncbi:MAG: hypothetical protein LBR74_05620 [Eubacterium sp.]|jgi:5'(3')-deoxyribonucleotidase|nr:hypothetical protein [Eubacterium sp.]
MIISQSDIDTLRNISPRKSVLNLSPDEKKSLQIFADNLNGELGRKSPFYRARNSDWREREQSVIKIVRVNNRKATFKSVKNDIKEQVITRKTVINPDTNCEIQISRRGLEDSLAHGVFHKNTILFNMLYCVDKIMKNSVLLDTAISEKNNNNKAHNTVFMHKYYGIFKFKNKPYIAKLTIEEFFVPPNGMKRRLYNLQDIEIKEEPLRHLAFTGNRLALSVLNGSKISIADLFAIVKACDKNFYTNMEDKVMAKLQAGSVYKLKPEENTTYTVLQIDGNIAHLKRIVNSEKTQDPTPYIVATGCKLKENGCIEWDSGQYLPNFIKFDNFINNYLNGIADFTELDSYFEYWHEKRPAKHFWGFLGITNYEAGHLLNEMMAVGKDNTQTILRDVIYCRQNGIDLANYDYNRPRLFVDIDGTLARFHDEVDYLERMFEKGFFRDLKPFQEAVDGINNFIKSNPNVEVFILSGAVDGEPPYCRAEKQEWLRRHLPDIDAGHMIFTKVGESKARFVPGGLRENDFLYDDYNVSLDQWEQEGGVGIKCRNNINHRGLNGKMWEGLILSNSVHPAQISKGLEEIMDKVVLEHKLYPQRDREAWEELKNMEEVELLPE